MSGNSNSQSLNLDNSSMHGALTTSLLDAQMLTVTSSAGKATRPGGHFTTDRNGGLGKKGVTRGEDLYSDPEGSEVTVEDSKQMINEEPKTIIETFEDIALDLEETVSRVSFVVQKALETPVYSKRRLIFLCILYIFAAANEYWVVNWLKQFGVNLPILFTIIQNGSWPIQYMLYKFEVRKAGIPRVITYDMYKSYFILGFLAFIISITRMYGLSQLPATLYVICANTEIVFETIMTKVILKRDVTNIQTTAVLIVIVGVCVSLYNPVNGSYGGESGGGGGKPSVVLIGVFLSLFSRFCSSLNTILAERLLGKDVKSKVGVNECAVANAVIPFFLTPVTFIFSKEYRFWGESLQRNSQFAQAVIILLLITLSLSKQVDRLCKFAIVGAASTIFFAGVDAFMKAVAAVGCFLFFGDLVTWANALGIILITFSVCLMFYEKYDKASKSTPEDPVARKSFAEKRIEKIQSRSSSRDERRSKSGHYLSSLAHTKKSIDLPVNSNRR